MVDIGNFSSTSFKNFDINLVQKEVDGGSVSVDQIAEAIGNTPKENIEMNRPDLKVGSFIGSFYCVQPGFLFF